MQDANGAGSIWCLALRLLEDLVAANSAPTDSWLPFNANPFECRSPIGPRERPGHLVDACRALDTLYSELLWPGFAPMAQLSVAGRGEILFGYPRELGVFLFRQAPYVAVELRGPLGFQLCGGRFFFRRRTPSKAARKSPTLSASFTRPAATCSSTRRSPFCHSAVQNHA